MNRIVVVAIGLIVLSVTTHARAVEPTGFAQFPWGTAATDVIQGQWCPWNGGSTKHIEANYARCGLYKIDGCCAVELKLTFDAGLAAYHMQPLGGGDPAVQAAANERFRTLVLDKFGPPHTSTSQEYVTGAGQRVTGEVLDWQWANVGASLLQICGRVTQPCLGVETKAFTDARAKQDAERREKAKRVF